MNRVARYLYANRLNRHVAGRDEGKLTTGRSISTSILGSGQYEGLIL